MDRRFRSLAKRAVGFGDKTRDDLRDWTAIGIVLSGLSLLMWLLILI
jgi:hypothetical protein